MDINNNTYDDKSYSGQAPGATPSRRSSTGTRGRVLLWAALMVVSLSVRAAYLYREQLFRQSGGAEMERAAVSLAREGTIARIYSDETGKSAHVCPLYPLFLAGLYRTFGWDTDAGRLAQELCAVAASTAGMALLPVVARTGGLSSPAGWAAAFMLAVLPVNLWVESSGSWEQPYAALALLGLFLLFCRLRDGRWRSGGLVVLGGGLLGLVALLSASVLPAGALMMAAELASGRTNRKRVAAGSLVMGLVAALVVAPWMVRNYYALGGFVPFRSNFGLELAIGNNSSANGKTFSTDWRDLDSPMARLHPFRNAEERARLQSMGELAYMRDKQRTATLWMAAHPAETLSLTLTRFRLYWFPRADLWPSDSPGSGVKMAVFGLTGLASLLGLCRLVLRRNDRAWLFVSATVGPSLAYMITHIDMRYRYPSFGLCTLLAFDFLHSAGRRVLRGWSGAGTGVPKARSQSPL